MLSAGCPAVDVASSANPLLNLNDGRGGSARPAGLGRLVAEPLLRQVKSSARSFQGL